MRIFSIRCSLSLFAAGLLAAAFTACQRVPDDMYVGRPAMESQVAAAAPAGPTVTARPTIRINAGATDDEKDPKGNTWSADNYFVDGMTNDRTDLEITGTDNPRIYQSERYSMEAYSIPVANGKYTLKLHFSEDFDGISAPEDRLFTYTVKDGDAKSGKVVKEVKDFSPWKAAGGQFKAYVDTVPMTVTNGRITITFTPQVENPQINAIEIVPS